MPRVVDFADGFYSASAPVVTGGQQERFEILNNANNESLEDSNGNLFEIDSIEYLSAFINYELVREDDSDSFIQSGQMQMVCVDGVWQLTFGNYDGDRMLLDSVSSPQDVSFAVTNNSGVGGISYSSGDMTGTDYEGVLRMSITRIAKI